MICRSLLMLALLGAPILVVASGCGGGAPSEGVMDAEGAPEPELTEEEVAGEEEYIQQQ